MIVIPARLASSRFPNKILANINGYPMVIATANRVKSLDRVIIATNSKEVIALAKDYGYEAVLTGSHHQSGTDRINEAVNLLHVEDDEVVVNVQADEPFIEQEVVKAVIERVKKRDCFMVSCYKLIDKVFEVENYKQELEYFIDGLLDDEVYDEFLWIKEEFLEENAEFINSCKEDELKNMYPEFWDKTSLFHTLRYELVYKICPTATPNRLKGKRCTNTV